MTRPVTKRKSMHYARKIRLLLRHGIIRCGLCDIRLLYDDEITFEHMHQLGTGGPDDDERIKPCHTVCSLKKTNGNGATSFGSDTHARAKEDRIHTGKFVVNKRAPGDPKPPSRWPSRKMESRPMRARP